MNQLILGNEPRKNSLELFNTLKEQGLLGETIKHNDFIKSSQFQELLQRENFSPCKIRVEKNNNGYAEINGYLLTEPQFIKCIMAFSKPM